MRSHLVLFFRVSETDRTCAALCLQIRSQPHSQDGRRRTGLSKLPVARPLAAHFPLFCQPVTPAINAPPSSDLDLVATTRTFHTLNVVSDSADVFFRGGLCVRVRVPRGGRPHQRDRARVVRRKTCTWISADVADHSLFLSRPPPSWVPIRALLFRSRRSPTRIRSRTAGQHLKRAPFFSHRAKRKLELAPLQ